MSRCRSCQAEVVWVVTEDLRKMPMDPAPVENGNLVKVRVEDGVGVVRYLKKGEEPPPGHGRYVSHFATCEFADEHRGKR